MGSSVSREIAASLAVALADLNLAESARDTMARHWELVERWGERVNLTGIDDPQKAAWLHYRDCLEALAVLPSGPIVDLGSGAGFPGLPIAIAQPERLVTLVEPRRKRASFLRATVARLHLPRVGVSEARAEAAPDQAYAAALTRATFSDWAALAPCLRWLAPGGALIAYRSAPLAGAPASTLRQYSLQGDERYLQIWQLGDRSAAPEKHLATQSQRH